jgi:2-amino-4-hydroxy-6-hydroxymethyldihydropteridine diphosphokinase
LRLQQQTDQKVGTMCLIAFGSNLFNQFTESVRVINAAIEELSSLGLVLVRTSGFYRTPAFPKDSGPDFVNGVVLCETSLAAGQVIAALHSVETLLGRTRKQRWEARVIDLDLIDFDGQIIPNRAVQAVWRELPLDQQMTQTPEQLILPHPRVQDRPFVLIPMRDVVPDWADPVSGQTIDALIARFDAVTLAEIQLL